ncbi:MAG: RluA family pseudouridine synthase [Pseudomonadota bacterium]
MSLSEPERFEVHVDVTSAADRAPPLLSQRTGLTVGQIKSAMTKGAVWITRSGHVQRLRRAGRALHAGDQLHLYYDANVLAQEPPEPALVADKGDYSVWHKPYGLRSQGSKWGDHCTLVRWAEQRLTPQRNAFTVHRLDRAASGLMLVAHSKRCAATLSALFAERRIDKQYRAVVVGAFVPDALPLRIDAPLDGKPAASVVIAAHVHTDKQCTDVELRIETGRKHQVRRHLAALGYPIAGDRLYGQSSEDDIDLQLTAYRLAFTCPMNDALVVFELPCA